MPDPMAVPPLTVEDFDAYFTALWGVKAFSWQRDLLVRVNADRCWPASIDLPTGTGKTSVIDIAVFVLALGATEPPTQQWHPRRIALVVDRRVIVDQANERGAHLAGRLQEATSGVLWTVAQRLKHLAMGPDGSSPSLPITHAVLRGGIVRDESWAFRPDVPAIISCTVDQVGSRLLFRGYGVSRGMRPIHAGLLANDVLYLLDEVHLAQPFADTLDQIGWYRTVGVGSAALPGRWQVVRLSATPVEVAGDRFPGRPLEAADDDVLARRLTARKPAQLVEVPVSADPARAHAHLAAAAVHQVSRLIASGARTVAIIVNRVDTARRARLALERSTTSASCTLITGRMRAVDKDAVLDAVRPRVAIGRERRADDRPLVLVATQSIEAGADFDLDAIVTECASLDALRQRFGRVDRDGRVSAGGHPFSSVVLAGSSSIAPGADDPVYGTALRLTWQWLRSLPSVDFGLRQLPVPTNSAQLRELLPEPKRAPYLLPSHLDRWVQTSEYGVAADPLVAHWLHGIQASSQAEDVSVIWREDLNESLLQQALDRAELSEAVAGRLNACPPSSGEALPVPAASLRQWLAVPNPAGEVEVADAWTDVTGATAPVHGHFQRAVVRWRDDQAEVVALDRVEPGDTVIVPCAVGGLSYRTWDPESSNPVDDVAMRAHTGRPVLRLSRVLAARTAEGSSVDGADASLEPVEQPAAQFPDPDVVEDLPVGERRRTVLDYLEFLRELVPDDATERPTLQRLLEVPERSLVLLPFLERVTGPSRQSSYVVTSRDTKATPHAGVVEDDGRDGSSFVAGAVILADHLAGVRRWSAQMAANLGFPDDVAAAVARAGQLHDLGKLDPRFQLWLLGGDEWRAVTPGAPLAKSVAPADRYSRDQEQRRSGYPKGLRHELLSLRLVTDGASTPMMDDLVLHLVASHHGRGRYRFGPQPDVADREIDFICGDDRYAGTTSYDLDRLDAGVSDRFWSLVRRWGWFGLAWLEAVLRLADHEDSRHPAIAYQGGDR